MKKLFKLAILLSLAGCMPSDIEVSKPDGSVLNIKFYPGGNSLDDLIIIDGKNYFGKAAYQFDDPMGDIGFTFLGGKKIRSECISKGKDLIGQEVPKLYGVSRSNFELIPEGTKVLRPQLY